MEDLIKKFLYTGVGIVSLTAEKLQETVDELVGKGKVSKDEGQKIVSDFFDKTEARREEMEGRFKEMIDRLSENLHMPHFASQEDIDQVLSRLDAIEAKLGLEKDAEPKAATKKTATRVKKTAAKAEEAPKK
jgi:polyhydroxyalkanoate synthesis regulator phasin